LRCNSSFKKSVLTTATCFCLQDTTPFLLYDRNADNAHEEYNQNYTAENSCLKPATTGHQWLAAGLGLFVVVALLDE